MSVVENILELSKNCSPADLRQTLIPAFFDRLSSADKYALVTDLHCFCKVDFFSKLPVEVGAKIVDYLDLRSIKQAAQVSKTWYRVITRNGEQPLWKIQCTFLGIFPSDENEAVWRKLCHFFWLMEHQSLSYVLGEVGRKMSFRRFILICSRFPELHFDGPELMIIERRSSMPDGFINIKLTVVDCSIGQSVEYPIPFVLRPYLMKKWKSNAGDHEETLSFVEEDPDDEGSVICSKYFLPSAAEQGGQKVRLAQHAGTIRTAASVVVGGREVVATLATDSSLKLWYTWDDSSAQSKSICLHTFHGLSVGVWGGRLEFVSFRDDDDQDRLFIVCFSPGKFSLHSAEPGDINIIDCSPILDSLMRESFETISSSIFRTWTKVELMRNVPQDNSSQFVVFIGNLKVSTRPSTNPKQQLSQTCCSFLVKVNGAFLDRVFVCTIDLSASNISPSFVPVVPVENRKNLPGTHAYTERIVELQSIGRQFAIMTVEIQRSVERRSATDIFEFRSERGWKHRFCCSLDQTTMRLQVAWLDGLKPDNSTTLICGTPSDTHCVELYPTTFTDFFEN